MTMKDEQEFAELMSNVYEPDFQALDRIKAQCGVELHYLPEAQAVLDSALWRTVGRAAELRRYSLSLTVRAEMDGLPALRNRNLVLDSLGEAYLRLMQLEGKIARLEAEREWT
jgi:hypothetical protein